MNINSIFYIQITYILFSRKAFKYKINIIYNILYKNKIFIIIYYNGHFV